ncbi:ABC transporter substrate-binding protein [Streptomyces sp. NPDC059092]|uniref:ABC transporter substrate-binding protein n=1 Tax=Streptomyces sp. NPDC059092 TaxID=3346725 RepID=UPI0036AF6273
MGDRPRGTGVANFGITLGASPNSLDVTGHFDTNAMAIMSLFTEPVERLSGDGSLTPNLAVKVTEPDDVTIVYTLREGVRFSDGTPLTAEDVVWTINHVSDADAGAATSSLISSVAGAKATGELEVTVTLDRPDPTARQSLALVALVQESRFAEKNSAELGQPTAVPVGTGPYRVTSSSAESVRLERNENYWGEAPVPDTVTISFLGSDDTAQRAMRSGSLNGALVANPVTLPQFESISGVTVFSRPALQAEYFSLDTTVAPFDDIHVRRAIAHAIDREGVMHAAYGANASLLRGLVPPGTLTPIASQVEVDALLDELKAIPFDLDAAADEIARSRHAGGFEMEVAVMPGTWMELAALNLRENLASFGVTVKVRSVSSQEWVQTIFGHKTTAMFPMSFGAAVPDPGLLRRVVSEEARTQAGGYNFANWAPEDLRTPAATLVDSRDDAERFAAARTVLLRIAEEVPYIPMYQPQFLIVLGEGFSFSEAPTAIDMASGIWMRRLIAE